MIVDFDDLCDEHAPLSLLNDLRQANPAFRCTLFAIPARCSADLLARVPGWCELAVHGWQHGDPPSDGGECRAWTREQMADLILKIEKLRSHGDRWVRGFKAPGWQISDGCYEALQDAGWWVADHFENDGRRPKGLWVHRLSPGSSNGLDLTHWHGHLHDVCGNGISETFPALLARVRETDTFETVGESVQPW